jgi:hypothetical protein
MALGASGALRVSLKLPTIYARLMKNSLLSHEGKMNGRGKMPQLARRAVSRGGAARAPAESR